MRIQFPTANIKGTPHIMSRLSAWKKSSGLLEKILNRSGVGFNSKGDYKFECDDDQWDQIVKAEPEARFMREKGWPLWPYWQIIFGKDRASGTFTENLMDSVNELHSQHSLENIQESIGTGGADFNLGDQPTPAPVDGTQTPPSAADSTGHNNPTKATSTSGGKKRKIEMGIEGLVHMLEKVHDDTNKRLDTLAQRIGYEFDLSQSRKHVYEQLGKLPDLSREQKFDVGGWILEKVERLDFFLGMPDEDRLAYVIRALEKYF
ncbi:uncharacterized protein LOC125200284 [Salvia hispanica]|uniref:uncharacterized protein LOC125200284 n=1 Tax=Salvia hispanica TaxID=49212 RepID=UPI002009C796|nr:uncharacterized protein LOC125200284 [Salvia hispanica]